MMDRCGRSEGNCKQPVVAVIRFGACSYCGRFDHVPYCAEHRDRILAGAGTRWNCREPYCGGKQLFECIVSGGYELARERYLETGLIADKDAMLAEVTVDRSADWWETFDTILAERPAPPVPAQRTPTFIRTSTAMWLVTIFLIGAFFLGLTLG